MNVCLGKAVRPYLTVVLLTALASPLSAQSSASQPTGARNRIELNGTLDLTSSLAGHNSKFVSNEIPPTYLDPHILIHEANLILFAPVDEDFSIEARLRIDSQGSGELHSPVLALAVFNWIPIDREFSFSVGRFVTPFGLFPRRQLQVQRTFIASPLAWGYFLPISQSHGYWPGLPDEVYRANDVGMTALGYDGLSNGIRYDWKDPEGRALHLAITNTAPCVAASSGNQLTSALIGHYVWGESGKVSRGISFCYGSFMAEDHSITPLLRNVPKYRQLALGADWSYTVGRLTFESELIASRWNVPRFQFTHFLASPEDSLDVTGVLPTLATGYLDTRFELPTRTFSYLAARIETMQFLPMNDPAVHSKRDWDGSVVRWTFAGGMNVTPSIRLKTSYSNQSSRGERRKLADWAVRLMATILF